MDNYILARNAAEAFYLALGDVYRHGIPRTVRGMNTKELTHRLVEIANPAERCILLPHRRDSIVAKCAETLWMMRGASGDIRWLSRYIPQAPKYADQDNVWRGAYGPRLRRWISCISMEETETIDQVRYVVDLLRADPFSRQAVMSIWDPEIDTHPGKDIPCNNWLQFLLRDGKLDLYIAQRSSDVWWGFSGIDVFQWSVLQQLIAHWVGADLGTYCHFIGSFHLYERHYSKAADMMDTMPVYLYDHYKFPTIYPTISIDDFDNEIMQLMIIEMSLRNAIQSNESVNYIDALWKSTMEYDPLLSTMTRIIMLGLVSDYNWEPICDWMDSMPISDLWIAILEWLSRKNPSILDSIKNITPDIYAHVWDYMLSDFRW